MSSHPVPIAFSARAFDDLDRLTDFLLEIDAELACRMAPLILEALQILERHPYIGRPVAAGRRELVISRRRSGYLALYRMDELRQQIDILAIRHQREAGYPDNDP